jgi:iron(III) transport system ATP-binding protein
VLEINNLVKSYAGGKKEPSGTRVMAVKGISLKVEQSKMFTMLGPSGCGKTTTLRCVAGLEAPDSGEINVDGRCMYSSTEGIRLRANERGLGMVFQSYAIWPHLNVFHNVSFPLEVEPRKTRPSKKVIRERVERALDVVQLDHLADRQATDLSGGQQQRLALARALVMEPPMLLLDEPLSNLDARLRDAMRFELKRLQRDLGLTAVYVTHDQTEALAMSDMVAVMRDGVIEQVGRPREIYDRPASKFVADFIGISNFIDGVVVGQESSLYEVRTEHGSLFAPSMIEPAQGSKVVVSIRPEHITLEKGHMEATGANVWHGVVKTRAFLGEAVDHMVMVGNAEVRSRCNPKMSFGEGTEVTLTLDQSMCSIIPA